MKKMQLLMAIVATALVTGLQTQAAVSKSQRALVIVSDLESRGAPNSHRFTGPLRQQLWLFLD